MNRRLTIASWLPYAASGLAFIAGVAYLLSATIMPYHERFLGRAHAELEPQTAALALAMMRAGGALFCALGAVTAIIAGPFRRGDAWAWRAVCAQATMALVPLTVITLRIGWYAPWWGPATALLLVGTALLLSGRESRRESPNTVDSLVDGYEKEAKR